MGQTKRAQQARETLNELRLGGITAEKLKQMFAEAKEMLECPKSTPHWGKRYESESPDKTTYVVQKNTFLHEYFTDVIDMLESKQDFNMLNETTRNVLVQYADILMEICPERVMSSTLLLPEIWEKAQNGKFDHIKPHNIETRLLIDDKQYVEEHASRLQDYNSNAGKLTGRVLTNIYNAVLKGQIKGSFCPHHITEIATAIDRVTRLGDVDRESGSNYFTINVTTDPAQRGYPNQVIHADEVVKHCKLDTLKFISANFDVMTQGVFSLFRSKDNQLDMKRLKTIVDEEIDRREKKIAKAEENHQKNNKIQDEECL